MLQLHFIRYLISWWILIGHQLSYQLIFLCQIREWELTNSLFMRIHQPSVIWRCWLGGRKGIWPVKKLEWWGAGMVICLEQSANDLHMVQLMPLPPHHLCFSKIQNGLSFWYWPTQVVLEKRPLNDCVCLCVCVWSFYVTRSIFVSHFSPVFVMWVLQPLCKLCSEQFRFPSCSTSRRQGQAGRSTWQRQCRHLCHQCRTSLF